MPKIVIHDENAFVPYLRTVWEHFDANEPPDVGQSNPYRPLLQRMMECGLVRKTPHAPVSIEIDPSLLGVAKETLEVALDGARSRSLEKSDVYLGVWVFTGDIEIVAANFD